MSNDATTQPTIETILERINEMREDLSKRFTAIEIELKDFRAETTRALMKLEDRVDVLSANVNKFRADVKRVNERLEAIEKQPA